MSDIDFKTYIQAPWIVKPAVYAAGENEGKIIDNDFIIMGSDGTDEYEPYQIARIDCEHTAKLIAAAPEMDSLVEDVIKFDEMPTTSQIDIINAMAAIVRKAKKIKKSIN